MPTKPPVATVSPSRMSLTASAAVTTLPFCPERSEARNGWFEKDMGAPRPRGGSVEARRVVDADCHEDGQRLDAGDGEDVAVGLAMRQARDREKRDDGA